jgi:hypothetical protein
MRRSQWTSPAASRRPPPPRPHCLAVNITPGFYLIGLSNMDADKDRNIQLLKELACFDIPVVYSNNLRAILRRWTYGVVLGTRGPLASTSVTLALREVLCAYPAAAAQ